jgi:hypothetical protein
MQNKPTYTDKDEEIDLAALFLRLWSVFKKRFRLFLIFFIVGIILGVLYYLFAPRTYKSRMIISSTVFQGPSFVIILDNLTILLKENNYEELASVLEIDLETAKKIKKIEVYSSKNYAEQEFGDKVTFKEDKTTVVQQEEQKEKKEEFVIEALVEENAVFEILEQGIINYINNNPAIKEVSMIKKQALNDMKNNINRQRKSLDSLQKSILAAVSRNGVSSEVFLGEPGSMYTDMVKLYRSEILATEELFASNINIIEKFRLYKKPYSPKLGLSLLVFTLLSVFLFLITVIIQENRKVKTS